MNTYEKLKKDLTELSEEINQRILSGDFEIIELGEHTSEIEVMGLKAEIWTANEKNQCHVYRINSGSITLNMPEGLGIFEDPVSCHQKVTTPKGEHKERIVCQKKEELERLSKEIERLES